MDSGLYAACAALVSRTQALDTVANNLANVSTTGFKGESPFYQALTAAAGGGALNQAVNQYGVLGGASLDLAQGGLQHTGNALDVALQGPGFLAVNHGGATLYTRAGDLALRPDGTLVTAAGDAVLSTQNQPIVLPQGTPSISPDGTVSVGGALVARLQVAEFAHPAQLTALGDAYFSAPAGAAQPSSATRVTSGALESSNVNPIAQEVDLIGLQRNSDFLERAIKIFNTDFDQTAAQNLPKL